MAVAFLTPQPGTTSSFPMGSRARILEDIASKVRSVVAEKYSAAQGDTACIGEKTGRERVPETRIGVGRVFDADSPPASASLLCDLDCELDCELNARN